MKAAPPSPDYLRGLRHGIQAGARVAYSYDRGRSWTGGEICQAIQALELNVTATAHVIKKLVNKRTDDLPIQSLGDPLAVPKKKG